MPRSTGAERRTHIRAIQAFITSGMGDREAGKAYNEQRRNAGQPELSRVTIWRYVQLAHREWEKEFDVPHRRWHSRAVANRLRAMRLALATQRHVVVGGTIEKVQEPDLAAYLKSCEQLDKLTGVESPEGRELAALQAQRMTMLVAEVLRDVVDDLPTRSRFLSELRRRAEALVLESGDRELLESPLSKIDAGTIEVKPIESGSHENGHLNGSMNGHIESADEQEGIEDLEGEV